MVTLLVRLCYVQGIAKVTISVNHLMHFNTVADFTNHLFQVLYLINNKLKPRVVNQSPRTSLSVGTKISYIHMMLKGGIRRFFSFLTLVRDG